MGVCAEWVSAKLGRGISENNLYVGMQKVRMFGGVVFAVCSFAYFSAFPGHSTFYLETSTVLFDRILEVFLAFTLSCCFTCGLSFVTISAISPSQSNLQLCCCLQYVKCDLCWNTSKSPLCIPHNSIPWTVNETDRWEKLFHFLASH